MSLLKQYARQCTILIPTRESDGEGGFRTTYTDGDTFENYQALNTSSKVQKAEKDALNSVYTVLVDQSVDLKFEDFFRDNGTGITYQVITDPNQKKSPASASFCLKYCEAEKRELPT